MCIILSPLTQILAESGESVEVAALRQNLADIIKTVKGDPQTFATNLIQREFIAQEEAQGILDIHGIMPSEKASKLINSVFVKIEVSDQKRHQFDKFVEIFSSEPAHSELATKLNRSISGGH